MSDCPDRAALEAWLRDDRASPSDDVASLRDDAAWLRTVAHSREIAEHVARCERCRARAQRARADDDLTRELRVVAGPVATDGDVCVRGYRIVGELRRGGQGVVYRATQEATRREVALKILAGGHAASARERRRFEREIELASRLRHPFVVTVFDSGSALGEPWYAMELVDGRPLDEWVRATRPSLRERVELFARISSGVAYAHRRGVIHRDLKPANILVDADLKPRLLDFGAARELDGPAALRVTAPGEFLGTLAYAAPEQLRPDAGEIDTRTDVYALGLVLYELVCGRLPFARDTSVGDLVDSAARDVEPPSRHARDAVDADRELDAVVLRALARDPAERYGSAAALEADVARYLAGEPLEARALDTGYVLRRALHRHRGKAAVAVLALSFGAAASMAWLREHARAEHQSEQAALVQSIFQDILGAAAPQRMGADVRLLEVFELAARQVDSALVGAPDVQAEVELTIGDTYRRLLRAEQAEPHLRRALERFEAVDDGRELEVARCADLLGLALSALNRPEAIAVQERALSIRERELEPGDPLVSESRRGLAIALLEQFRDVDEARARVLLDEALAGFRAAFGDDHPETAHTKLWRARAESDLSPLEVESLLAGAAATFERRAPDDPRAIETFNAYSAWLSRVARFDEAALWLERSVAVAQGTFGDALATETLRSFARLEFARGDSRAAEQLTRQALAHELLRWAELRPDEAPWLRALARRVEQPGAPDAEPPYAEAFGALRGFMGDGSFELAQWINGTALALRAQGRMAATEAMLREALAIRCRAMGADCPVRQTTIELYAEALLADRRGAEAIPLLDESIATFDRNGDVSGSEAARARDLLAACRSQASGSAPQ